MDLGHVQAGQVTPGTANAVKSSPFQVLQQFGPVKLGIYVASGCFEVRASLAENP